MSQEKNAFSPYGLGAIAALTQGGLAGLNRANTSLSPKDKPIESGIQKGIAQTLGNLAVSMPTMMLTRYLTNANAHPVMSALAALAVGIPTGIAGGKILPGLLAKGSQMRQDAARGSDERFASMKSKTANITEFLHSLFSQNITPRQLTQETTFLSPETLNKITFTPASATNVAATLAPAGHAIEKLQPSFATIAGKPLMVSPEVHTEMLENLTKAVSHNMGYSALIPGIMGAGIGLASDDPTKAITKGVAAAGSGVASHLLTKALLGPHSEWAPAAAIAGGLLGQKVLTAAAKSWKCESCGKIKNFCGCNKNKPLKATKHEEPEEVTEKEAQSFSSPMGMPHPQEMSATAQPATPNPGSGADMLENGMSPLGNPGSLGDTPKKKKKPEKKPEQIKKTADCSTFMNTFMTRWNKSKGTSIDAKLNLFRKNGFSNSFQHNQGNR